MTNFAKGSRVKTRYKPIKHGTVAGYKAENRAGERACPACLKAWRMYYATTGRRLPRVVWARLSPIDKQAIVDLRKSAERYKAFKAWEEQNARDLHSPVGNQIGQTVHEENEVAVPGRTPEEGEHPGDEGGLGDIGSHGTTEVL